MTKDSKESKQCRHNPVQQGGHCKTETLCAGGQAGCERGAVRDRGRDEVQL